MLRTFCSLNPMEEQCYNARCLEIVIHLALAYMTTYFLLLNSVNVTLGNKEERMMMTGMHTVVDIFCVGCGSLVGWKYVS